MFHRVLESFKREDGQDLSEYCLLMALIALVALGIVIHVSGGVQNLWTVANTSLGNASTSSTTTTGGGQGSQPQR
jgi:Flp pilus assembly pilin Flp